MRPGALLALLAVLLAPVVQAEPVFPGMDRLELEHAEEGTTTASVTHDYSDSGWVRTYELSIDWSRVGVYTLDRVAGIDAFAGEGKEYLEVEGSARVVLDDQGVASTLVCTLSKSETRDAGAYLAQLEGTLLVAAGRGLLDDDAWDCDSSGVLSTTHGGVGNVVLAGYALGAAEGLSSGQFPAALAVLLGLADSEDEWADEEDKEGAVEELIRTGYVEAEPKLGEQRVPFARQYAPDAGDFGYVACPDMDVDDTPATGGSCDVDSRTRIELSRAGVVSSSGTGANAPASSATPSTGGSDADTPGAPFVLLLAGLAAAALVAGRR